MYPYLGDFEAGKTIFFPFHTFNSSGASVTLTGLAVTDIEVFKGASMTQRASDNGYALVDTDGIDLDSITGFHGFTIDTSDNSDSGFYAAGNDYTVVVSAVTVDSQTVNFIAGRFSISNRAGLKPTVEGRTLDVTSTGEAGLDFNNVNLPAGAIPSLGVVDNGTAQSATGTTLVLRSAAAFADDELIGATIVITGGSAGVGQARTITDYVSSTDTATVDTWTTTPSGTITYMIFGGSPASTSLVPNVNVVQVSGDATAADNLEAILDGTGANLSLAALTVSAGVTITQSTTNGNGLSVTGNGTGNGAIFTSGSGATGAAIRAVAASTNGSALSLAGTGTGSGVSAAGGTSGNGITALGGGAGHGISTTGGATGAGLRVIGGGTSGAGVAVTTTSGDGVQITPTAGHGIVATANGASKHGLVATGGTSGTSDGIKAVAGTGGIDFRGDITGNTMTESYATDGAAPTIAQALFLTMQSVGEVSVSGTTMTVKKLDGTTTAATYTLDDSSAPTSRTRAS